MKKLEAICVISAKARSTRFPGKNLARLAGKPLVTRTVEVAIESSVFDVVMVSTDDMTIAQLARYAGAEVPFMRDQALTEDTVEVPAVVRNALEWYERERGLVFEWVCMLQPTSPLRTAADVVASRKLLDDDPEADAVVSVSRYRHHPYWALHLQGNLIKPVRSDEATSSRQHMPELVHPDGAVYWWRTASLMAGRSIYEGRVLAYLTPPASSLDIDFPEDLEYAEWLIAHRRQES